MSFAPLRSWFRAITRRDRMERDMDTELRFHMERYAEDLVLQGIEPAEANRRARQEFGAVALRKEECREALGLRSIGEVTADIRYALRMLRQAPGFATVAILSLALGIGANTAIFSLMETALWKTMPVRNPEQLRLFSWVSGPKAVMDSSWGNWDQTPARGTSSTSFSYPVFEEFERHNAVLQDLFAFKPIGRITAVIDGQAELVNGMMVSGKFYQGLGVSSIAGRTILPADDTRHADNTVAVISYGYWNRRFGRDASVIGKQIALNQVPATIVGVNPPDFTGVQPGENPDVYLPMSLQPAVIPNQYSKIPLLDDPDYWWVLIMGRLKAGVSEAQAQSDLDLAMLQAVRATLPTRLDRDLPRLRLITGSRGLDDLRGQFSKPLFVLVAFVGLVLLIACANLANLLLARATARQREISVRLALGAGNWRITRQMLTEGLLLALLGGTAGLLLGYWARNGIPSLMASSWRPGPFQGQFDAKVLGMSLALALATGLLFSLAPAWQAARTQVNSALKDGSRSTMSLPKLLAGKSLVVLQVSLSVLLLVGAGLFVRTLTNLQSASLGFRPERILLFTIDPPRTRYAGDRRVALFQHLEEQIATISGIRSSTLSATALVANSTSRTRVAPAGRKPGPDEHAWINLVGDRFFETMGIPILYGRPVGAQDRANAPKTAVVNQAFVRHFFPGEIPLGKIFGNNPKDLYQIVGVCGDARYNQIRGDVPPTFYVPYKQAKDVRDMTFEAKTAASEDSVVRAVREVVRSIDKDLPVFDIRTQAEQIDATLSHERLFAVLTTGFGVLALLLACVGIYGVMAYAVARRTSEIGLRMALGAHSRQVLAMILRETVSLAGVGVVIGVIAAAALTRYLESMLFGLKPSDPATLCTAVLVMAAVALVAGWLPARKASRLDPMIALRHE